MVSVRAVSTFSVELESMERMLMQIELTVMAGDHESYKISATMIHNIRYFFQEAYVK
jgi:phosphopantetheine adenylyltransferase